MHRCIKFKLARTSVAIHEFRLIGGRARPHDRPTWLNRVGCFVARGVFHNQVNGLAM